MNCFEFSDYREALDFVIQEKKKISMEYSITKIAKNLGIHGTYITNVIKGRADLNSDQIFQITEFLRLEDDEKQFLRLLLEENRSIVQERKKVLMAEIQELRKKHLNVSKHLKAKKKDQVIDSSINYYLDPMIRIVHIFLIIPKFARNPDEIAPALGIPLLHLNGIIDTLESIGYIQREADGAITVKEETVHLDKNSKVSQADVSLTKLKSIEHIFKVPKDKRHTFVVTFASNEKNRQKIQARFLDFISDAEEIAKQGKIESVFQMNFDLFPWEI